MDVRTLRQIELICGVAPGVFGVLLPPYRIVVGHEDLGTDHGNVAALLVFVGIAVATAAAAYLDSQFHDVASAEVGLAVLWSIVVVLLG